MKILAIDQGTTSTRGFTLSGGERQRIATCTHQQHYPEPGRVEHDPLEVISHIEQCIEAAGAVDGIAIANQGESCLAWDSETKEPISRIIVWQDQRTESVVNKLKADGVDDFVFTKTGLPLDSYFSATKLAWLYKNADGAKELHKAGRLRLGATDAFFLDRLTGEHCTDAATASRTSLMDLELLQWDEELCALFGVPMDTLPRIRNCDGPFGVVTGIARPAPVLASVVDQQAALFGHGCALPGDRKITFGTGAFALAIAGDAPKRDPNRRLTSTLAWRLGDAPAVYAQEGGVYNAGSALNWARKLGLFNDFSELNDLAPPYAIDEGVAFIPALSGIGCPYWMRDAKGAWLGLTLGVDAQTLCKAILEGVAMRSVQILSLLTNEGAERGFISVDGGLVNNDYFLKFLADAANQEIRVPSEHELTILGAARMAARDTIPPTTPARTVAPDRHDPERMARFESAVAAMDQYRRRAQMNPQHEG